MKRIPHLAALSTLILAFVVPNSASSNPVGEMSPVSENLEQRILSPGEAIAETAAGIAQVSGRTVTEVRAMLDVRKTFDGLIEEVAELDGFAGSWISYDEKFMPTLNIAATKAAEDSISAAVLGVSGLKLVAAKSSLAEMELEQTRLAKESHGFFTALTVDVQHNRLNVWAAEGGVSSHLEALAPRVSTNLLFDQATPAPASGVSGGVAMWWTVSPARRCTSGFSLWNPGTSQTAVLTAGHCQWFYGSIPPSMPGDPNWVALATGTDAAYYSNLDRELHIVPAPHTALPRIATYWGWVPPTGSVSNSSVITGDFLCKTGFWTSTSCWNVTSTAYTIPGGTNEYPYNMFDLITGSIGRNVPNTDGACHGGDSGGPVWDGYVRAVGIIHGRLLPFGGDGSQTGCIVAKIANQLPAGWFIRTS